MLRLLSLLVLLAAPAAAQEATVQGTVRDATTAAPLAEANVRVEGTDLGTVTGADGRYVLRGLAPGRVTLVVSFVGYAPTRRTVRLSAGETRREDFVLEPRAVEGDEVLVEADEPIEEERAIGLQEVPIRLVQQIPSAFEDDLFRSIQLLPGVKAASDFSSRLYIRGGSPDQTLILLDEVPVYNPTHFFGFFSTFNTDAIDNVRLYKGGFPAYYGGRLGSVISVENRAGQRAGVGGTASVGLLASRLGFEGPYRLGGAEGSWMLALRRSTLEPLLAVLRQTEDQIPETFYFYDFNARTSLDLGAGHRLTLAGYAGTDLVRFPFAEDASFGLRYGNQTGSLRYTRVFSPRLFGSFRLLGSRYVNYPRGEVAGIEFERDNTIEEWAVKGDGEWLVRPGLTLAGGVRGGLFTTEVQDVFDGIETFGRRIQARTFSGYTEAELRPTAAWILTGGLRASAFSEGGYVRLMPRLSVERKWGERLIAQAAYGRYVQYLALISNEAFTGFDVWVTAADGVPPAYGDQFVLGLKTRPTRATAFDVEVYYRTLRDLFEFDPTVPDPTGLPYADFFRFGRGYAAGLEVLAEQRRGRLTGFLAYTFGVTRRTFRSADGRPVNDPGGTGEPQAFPPKYDRLHDLALVLNYDLGRSWTLTGAFTYATGQAYTRPTGRYEVVTIPGLDDDVLVTPGLNRARLPAYHRLDLGLTRTGSFFGLGAYELRLQAINVYNRRNVWFYDYDFETSPLERTAVRMLPILPNVAFTLDF